MKKKLWIPIISVAALLVAAVVVLSVLVIPIPTGAMREGGSREYSALTYKIIDWHRITDDGVYDQTRIYFFPKNFKSSEELWLLEQEKVEQIFTATILELNGTTAIVEPVDGQLELSSSDRFSIGISALENIGAEVGSVVDITYKGGIMESYPAQVNAISWKLSGNLRHLEYTDEWLDKEAAEEYGNNIFDHIRITKIYSNCFFAQPVIAMPYNIKLNGSLSPDWCVGDQVQCTYENTYYDAETDRVEADMLTISESDWEPDPYACYKPVIYLYPEEETEVSVKVEPQGGLTCTYPKYKDGWRVTALPDGTLYDQKRQSYSYLYWEGDIYFELSVKEGFCVKGEDTAEFLEDALEQLGLSRREANEFIVYWLPIMEQNEYNLISFDTAAYTAAAPLTVSPAPDTTIRVFMTFRASEKYVDLPEQILSSPERRGFTVVEWGGSEIK